MLHLLATCSAIVTLCTLGSREWQLRFKEGTQMRKLMLALTGITVAACAQAPIQQEPIPYRATKNLQENGTSSFVVRSVSKNGYQEIAGVPCEFKADGFRSTFTTPALVLSPNMGLRTPVASLTCTYNGQQFFQLMQPINDTTAAIDANANAAGAGAGLIGLIVSGVSSSTQRARRDATLDMYGYVDIVAAFN